MFIDFKILVKAYLVGIPEGLGTYYHLSMLQQKIRREGFIKEDSTEICTKYCAFLHSFLCMQKEGVKLEPLLRNRPGRFIYVSF